MRVSVRDYGELILNSNELELENGLILKVSVPDYGELILNNF